jgi:hypothetical protein
MVVWVREENLGSSVSDSELSVPVLYLVQTRHIALKEFRGTTEIERDLGF